MQQKTKYGLILRIRYADEREEQMQLESDRLLIGSGAHCDIRLPHEGAATEHVAVKLLSGAVYVTALALEPPPTVSGVPLNVETRLSPQDVLGIGSVQIWIACTELHVSPSPFASRSQKTSPLTFVALLVGLPLSAYLFLTDNDSSKTVGPAPTPVPLWGTESVTCPQSASDQALVVALDKRLLAEGKRERRPFFVQDGVQAVPLFEMAAACFRLANQPYEAEEMLQSARDLRTALNEDYRAHQMRLYHALTVTDLGTAQQEVRALSALTASQVGPYVTWLNTLDRHLQLQVSKKPKTDDG